MAVDAVTATNKADIVAATKGANGIGGRVAQEEASIFETKPQVNNNFTKLVMQDFKQGGFLNLFGAFWLGSWIASSSNMLKRRFPVVSAVAKGISVLSLIGLGLSGYNKYKVNNIKNS